MDDLFESINPFGLYQKSVQILIGMSSMLQAMTIYSTIFTTANPNISCISYENSTKIDHCTIIDSNLEPFNLTTSYYECAYDSVHYGSTLITEYSLLCDKKIYARITQSVFMIGTFASFIFGYLSDRIGRRKISLILLFFLTLFLSLNEIFHLKHFNLSIKTKLVVYTVTQFFSGLLGIGLFAVTYVLLTEFTTTKYKTKITNIMIYWYVTGELIIMFVCYLLKDWHLINWFICAFSLLTFVISVFLLPESPRYLVQAKRIEEANNLISKIAKVNRTKNYDSTQIESLIKEEKTNETENIFGIILSDKMIIIKSLLLAFVWVSIMLVYFGMGLGITSFSDINPYLMYLLSSFSELSGCFLAYLSDFFNRKNTFMGFLFGASLTCFVIAFIPQDTSDDFTIAKYLMISCTVIGRSMVSASLICAYVYTTGMIPTKIRGTILLTISSLGRIGSIISPLINHIGELVWKPLTFIIFASSSLISTIIIGVLKDTEELNY